MVKIEEISFHLINDFVLVVYQKISLPGCGIDFLYFYDSYLHHFRTVWFCWTVYEIDRKSL